jgi:anti-sigma regulatory factor (Ser/Thr protein kinase)
VEEIFTNMVKYNLKSKKEISVELSKKGENLFITFTDCNGKPFRLESSAPYNTGLPLEERPVGKLGIHLVKKYIDDIQYEYTDGRSTITFKKKLKDTHV